MNEQLQKKVDFAIRLLQGAEKMAEKVGQPVEICYSGGKDSDVILELARMSGIKYRAIYKNTTIDYPGTIKHAREVGADILQPKMNFRQIIEKMGYPNMFRRFCCGILKEYKVLDYAVVGIRRSESTKRAARYKEPETCRVYSKTKKVRQYMPILEWSDDDVIEFIAERGIKCHPLYYDAEGSFHVDRRCGCVGCPIAGKYKRLEQFKRFPGFLKLYLRACRVYFDTHPNAKNKPVVRNEYGWLVAELFYDDIHKFKAAYSQNIFGEEPDFKKMLEDYFGIKL